MGQLITAAALGVMGLTGSWAPGAAARACGGLHDGGAWLEWGESGPIAVRSDDGCVLVLVADSPEINDPGTGGTLVVRGLSGEGDRFVVARRDEVAWGVLLTAGGPVELRPASGMVGVGAGQEGGEAGVDRLRVRVSGPEGHAGHECGGGLPPPAWSANGRRGVVGPGRARMDGGAGERDPGGGAPGESRSVPRRWGGVQAPSDAAGGGGQVDGPPATIRVLVLIDAAAEAEAGGRPSADVLAAAGVAVANEAMGRSEINNVRFDLVGTAAVVLPESFSNAERLTWVTDPLDGVADDVHALRDAVGADLVVTLVDSQGGSCGLAWLAPDDASLGFSVVDWSCAVSDLTLAHEMGHNLGCSHDPDNAGFPWAPGAFGHAWMGTDGVRYRSLMAVGAGVRVAQVSSPRVEFKGAATGIAGERDNSRLIAGATGALVAAFRLDVPGRLDCDGDRVADAIAVFEGGASDCDGNAVPDACQIAAGVSTDCDGNGMPDECQLRSPVELLRGPVMPFGSGRRLEVELEDLPLATGDVVAVVAVSADLSSAEEFVDVVLAGRVIARLFESGGVDCPQVPQEREVTIGRAEFNAAVAGGDELELVASAFVNPSLCPRGSGVSVILRYVGEMGDMDRDGNGVLDSCEGCAADVTGDGRLDIFDVLGFFTAFGGGQGAADVAAPKGHLDIFDVLRFFELFAAGC